MRLMNYADFFIDATVVAGWHSALSTQQMARGGWTLVRRTTLPDGHRARGQAAPVVEGGMAAAANPTPYSARTLPQAGGIWSGVRVPYGRGHAAAAALDARAGGSRPVRPHGRAEGAVKGRALAAAEAPPSRWPGPRALTARRLSRENWTVTHAASSHHH